MPSDNTHWRRVTRLIALTVVTASSLVATGFGAASNAVTSAPLARTISGSVIDSVDEAVVPDTCIYPLFSATAASAPLSVPYNIAQALPGPCTAMTGAYSNLSMPPKLAGSFPAARALVLSPTPILVSEVFDVPATEGGVTFALGVSTAVVSGDVTNGGAPWVGAIASIVDVNTGQVYGYAPVDASGHWTVGVSIPSPATITPVFIAPPGSANALGEVPTQFAVTPGVNLDTGLHAIPAMAQVQGRVTSDGTHGLPWQIVGSLCSQVGCAAQLAVTNADGTFTLWLPAAQSQTLTYGSSRVTATFQSGLTQLTSARLAPSGQTLASYKSPPRTWLAVRPTVALAQPPTWAWTGGSPESAALQWQHRYAVSSWRTKLGSYSGWVNDTTQSARVYVTPGTTTCMQVRTLSLFAALTASYYGTSTTQCQSMPLDDRSFALSGKWRRTTSGSAYGRTLVVTSTPKSTLTLKGVVGHQLAVVYARSTIGGTVLVAVNGVPIRTFSTKGASASKQITYLPVRALSNATVTLTTTSSGLVQIDGIAVLP